MNKFIFKYEYDEKTNAAPYPLKYAITVEVDGDSNIDSLIQAFQMLLKGCEYNEGQVESIRRY